MSFQNPSILIVEDDLSFALELNMQIKAIGYHVMDIVDNSTDALEIIQTQQPHLVLMDININGTSTGIDIAQQVQHLDVPILFLTSCRDEETYTNAQATNQIGYLTKPIDNFTLRSTINLAMRSLTPTPSQSNTQTQPSEQQSLLIKKKNISKQIFFKDIIYIKANGDYTLVNTNEGEFISSLRLNEILSSIEHSSLLQVHRSYIINIDFIDALNAQKNNIILGDVLIPISRRLRKKVLEQIGSINLREK